MAVCWGSSAPIPCWLVARCSPCSWRQPTPQSLPRCAAKGLWALHAGLQAECPGGQLSVWLPRWGERGRWGQVGVVALLLAVHCRTGLATGRCTGGAAATAPCTLLSFRAVWWALGLATLGQCDAPPCGVAAGRASWRWRCVADRPGLSFPWALQDLCLLASPGPALGSALTPALTSSFVCPLSWLPVQTPVSAIHSRQGTAIACRRRAGAGGPCPSLGERRPAGVLCISVPLSKSRSLRAPLYRSCLPRGNNESSWLPSGLGIGTAVR